MWRTLGSKSSVSLTTRWPLDLPFVHWMPLWTKHRRHARSSVKQRQRVMLLLRKKGVGQTLKMERIASARGLTIEKVEGNGAKDTPRDRAFFLRSGCFFLENLINIAAEKKFVRYALSSCNSHTCANFIRFFYCFCLSSVFGATIVCHLHPIWRCWMCIPFIVHTPIQV